MRKCQPGCTCGHHTAFSPQRREFLHGEKNKAHLRQLAAQHNGQTYSEEHRRNISEGLRGKPLSEEHRRKISEISRDPAMKARRRAARIARRKPPETYRQVHKRLLTDRGPAKNYPCVDCGEPAKDWSRDGLTWENVAQGISGKRLLFSTDLSVYRPRCQLCHNRLDNLGVRNGCAKLTAADVLWIRARTMSPKASAAVLGIDKTTVYKILKGKAWKHVP
jgi:hypothetical protein